jgi:hypothetical protein
LTFTSYAWGGRNAFENLSGDYLSKGGRQFPVVTLSSRPKKNDDKGNFEPVLSIVGWKVASDFADMLADMLPPPAPQPIALAPPKRTGPETNEVPGPGSGPGDDDIPF